MEAKLVALAPAEIVNTEFNLQLPVTIGRGRDAKIKLVHGQISRLHCEVYEDNGELKARDLGSLNGTFVDGERISDATLKPGGMLNIGSVTFRAVYGVMPAETDDSAVEFGVPRITDTVSATSTVMEEVFPGFGAVQEEPAAASDDDLGMFDFTGEPTPAKAETPKPAPPSPPAPPVPPAVAPQQAAIMPAKAAPMPPAAPAFIPPAVPETPAKEADVDDWLNITETSEESNPPADDEDLNSFFSGLK